jgi:hypothetical protein
MNTTTNNPSDLETSTSTDGIRSLEDLPPEQRRQAELFQRAHQQVAPCIRPRIEEIQNISEAGDVRLIVEYGRDGTPLTADLPSDAPARLETNNTYRAVVNAILNGVNECAPLDGMPEEEFDTWRLLPFGLRLAPT